ncbi:MAG: MEMO1 family protein [Nitrososphaeraceae archaeon]
MSGNPSRLPAVSGIFYPSEPLELQRLIEQSFRDQKFGPGKIPPSEFKRRIYGIVSPHAGYVYSGAVAANGFYEVSSMDFDNVVMIGPNHYGIGTGVATMRNGVWETPLGGIEINPDLVSEISKSGIIDFDDFAHSRDHCLEVQIPFLQYIKKNKKIRIVPIILIMQDIKTAMDIGEAIAQSIRNTSNALLIASSDFTHYESNDEAHRKDSELIKAILSLNISEFYTVLDRLAVSACGYGAIASVMKAANDLGATKGELLKYATSGNVIGDMSAVVGYSSIIFV